MILCGKTRKVKPFIDSITSAKRVAAQCIRVGVQEYHNEVVNRYLYDVWFPIWDTTEDVVRLLLWNTLKETWSTPQ